MATKKPAAKKVVAKKPVAVKTTPAPVAAKKVAAKTSPKQVEKAVKKILAPTNIPEAAKIAVAKEVAAKTDKPVTVQVHGAAAGKPTKRTVKLNKGETKAFHAAKSPKEQAQVVVKAAAKNERVRRAAQGHLADVAAKVKTKANEMADKAGKAPTAPPAVPKKAALVSPGPRSKPAPAPAIPSGADIWARSLGAAPKKPESAVDQMKSFLRAPSASFSQPVESKPAQPPAVPKTTHQPKPGSLSVADMNNAIASRRQTSTPAFDVKSLPFKR